ncbi:MAG: hypothetical protein PHU07_06820 [Acidocella sp.]|nr:hypothetical protein [Acidocella sp.]
MRQHIFALAAFAALLPLGAAHGQPLVQSQEGIALQNEILELQQQVQQLQGNGGSALGSSNAPAPSSGNSAAPANGLVASLVTQVQQLQSQVQDLNGKVDELQNQVNTQHDATEKEIGDLKFQMTNGATPGAAPAAGAQAAASAAAPQSLAASPSAPAAAASTPKAALKDALTAYGKHDYAGAAALAQSIVSKNKSAPEAYRAQYLLAQSLSAQGKSQDAAIAYDDTYNMNRTGSYAPQSLLGLAGSLAAINQNEAACSTIASLNSQFPTPPTGMQPRIDAVSKRANCQ